MVGIPYGESSINNIFSTRVTYTDLEVTIKAETQNMIKNDQTIWLDFSPSDYPSREIPYMGRTLPGQTVELGIAFSENEGYLVYMWACSYDECDSFNVQSLGHTVVPFKNEVYLKLIRKGTNYSGYYSFDGAAWSFAGEIKDFGFRTDQILFGVGGSNQEFDVYIDYVRFNVPGYR